MEVEEKKVQVKTYKLFFLADDKTNSVSEKVFISDY